jgi:DNA-binding transcriptional regulator YdaS (Cro superfamily)
MQKGWLAVLARAAEMTGGREELARRLGVRPQLLDSWLAGATPIPEAVFLKAVDLVSVPDR